MDAMRQELSAARAAAEDNTRTASRPRDELTEASRVIERLQNDLATWKDQFQIPLGCGARPHHVDSAYDDDDDGPGQTDEPDHHQDALRGARTLIAGLSSGGPPPPSVGGGGGGWDGNDRPPVPPYGGRGGPGRGRQVMVGPQHPEDRVVAAPLR